MSDCAGEFFDSPCGVRYEGWHVNGDAGVAEGTDTVVAVPVFASVEWEVGVAFGAFDEVSHVMARPRRCVLRVARHIQARAGV